MRIPCAARRRVVALRHGPTGPIHPTIDGRESSYYEWLYAGRIDLRQQYAAIHRAEQVLRRLLYGFDDTQQYFSIDLDTGKLAQLSGWTIELTLSHGITMQVVPDAASARAQVLSPSQVALPCALDRVLELAVPRDLLKLKPSEKLEVAITLRRADDVIERHPTSGVFELTTSAAELEAQTWSV